MPRNSANARGSLRHCKCVGLASNTISVDDEGGLKGVCRKFVRHEAILALGVGDEAVIRRVHAGVLSSASTRAKVVDTTLLNMLKDMVVTGEIGIDFVLGQKGHKIFDERGRIAMLALGRRVARKVAHNDGPSGVRTLQPPLDNVELLLVGDAIRRREVDFILLGEIATNRGVGALGNDP